MMVDLREGIHTVAAGWGPVLFRACWQGAITICVVFAVSRLLTRLSPLIRDSLWRLAHIKLVVALFWTTPLVIPILPATRADLPVSRVSAPAPYANDIEPSIPISNPREPATLSSGGVPRTSSLGRNPGFSGWNLTTALLVAWAVGLIGYGILVVRGLMAAIRLRAACQPLRDADVVEIYSELCRALGIRRTPQLLESSREMSPLLTGLLRPAIVLPSRLLAECDQDELRLVLMHELAHLRRGDLLWSWLPVVTRLLFFFHPLVWIADREWRDAQETACDATAIDAAGVGVAEYAAVLLKVAAICRPDPVGPTPALGITESFRTLRRRLIAMESVRRNVPRTWAVTGSALIALALTTMVPWQLGTRPAAAGNASKAAATLAGSPIYDFEKDTQGWFSRLQGAGLSVSRNPETVKVGKGSLEWAYNPNLPNAMLVRFQPKLPSAGTTLDFWLKSSAAGAFQVYLVEHDGSVYHMHLRPAAGVWHHYQVPLSDLVQGEREDTNGRLDLDQVTEIVLQDLSAHHSGGKRLEGRQVWLDGFGFNNVEAPSRRLVRAIPGGGREILIDDFQLPTLTWAGNTNARLTLDRTDGRGILRARYRAGANSPSRFQITNHFDPRYARTKAIRVVARASKPTQLSVSLREFDGTFTGPEFLSTCQLRAGREWQTFVLPVSQFRQLRQAAESARGVDPARVWLMLVGDVTQNQDDTDTELEIDSISAQVTE